MKLHTVRLHDTKEEIIIDYHSPYACPVCKAKGYKALNSKEEMIMVELTGLSEWKRHKHPKNLIY